MNEKQIREIIRDEIIHAVKIWQNECATMEYTLFDRRGNCCGTYSATLREKVDRFVECMKE